MKVWIYLDGRQQGPFEFEELLDIEGLNENTKVWFEGLPKWYPAGSLEQMRPLFDGTLMRKPSQEETIQTEEPEVQQSEQASGMGIEDNTTPEPHIEQEADAAPEESNEPTNHTQLPPPRPARYAPGAVYHPVQTAEPCPATYLAWSIILLICCCSPLSLAAVIGSICVSSYYSKGNLERAKKASEITAWLIMISIALGMLPVMFLSAVL